MVKTKEEAVSLVKRIVNELKGEIEISQVYLFGSYVNGSSNEESDIDVGLIIKDDIDFDDKLKLFSKVQKMNSFVELFIFSEKDFNIVSSDIVYEIKNKGIRVI